MVDGEKLGSAGFKYLGVPYSQMDCQAFVEQCLRDCGLDKNLAGSNAWFREVNKNGVIMTPEECVKELGTVPKGAFLFILEHDGGEPEKYKPDGLGNASHIGLVTGKGKGAIHSSASRGCVAESEFHNKTIKNGGWNRVGLWDQVIYDYGPGPSPDPDPDPGPSPEPEPQYAEVWSANGKPVNTRKKPSTNADQAGPGKLPVGTVVEILKKETKQDGEWDYIRYTDDRGVTWKCWMKDEFLVPMITPDPDPEPEPDPATTLYTVTIPHLTIYQAEALKDKYIGSSMVPENG